MKKILQYFILTIMAVCFSIPAFSSAEAATVALLPLVNNVKGDELSGQIFYQEAIGTLNDYPEYMMIENDKLTAAIEKPILPMLLMKLLYVLSPRMVT